MKIFAISDLHLSFDTQKPMNVFGEKWENYEEKISSSWREKVAEDDVVLLSGDLSWGMKPKDALKDIAFLENLPGKKVIIKGNHDYWWQSISKVRSCLRENTFAIQNDALRIGNYLFCGTRGWVVPYQNVTEEDTKLFLRETERLKLSLLEMEKMRRDGDVVIGLMHFPPFNVKRESSAFSKLFQEFNVKKVVYGHLHGKDGRMDQKVFLDGCEYFLTSCDFLKFEVLEIL